MFAVDVIRLGVGFTVVPVLAVFLFGFGDCLLKEDWSSSATLIAKCSNVGESLVPMGGIVALAASFVFGGPLFFLFLIRGWLGFLQVLIASTTIGAICMGALFGFASLKSDPSYFLPGPIAGVLFWMVSLWRNRTVLPESSSSN